LIQKRAVTFLAQKAGGAVASFAIIPLDARIANAAVAYVQYLAKLFWPVNLSPIYLHPDHWGFWPVTGAAAGLVLLTAAVWRGRRRFPYALMGWLWFLGMLVPVIGIVQVGSQAFADRYTYLPLLGIMVALVWLGAEAIRPLAKASPVVRSVLPAVLALALLASLAWRTREQLANWKGTGALFSHALEVTPNNVQALYGLGAYMVDSGRIDEGKRLLEKAIDLQPAYPEALGTMATILDGQGKYAEAIRFYQAALKAQPDQEGVLNNLAWLLATCPDTAFRNGPEAVRLATRACELTRYAKPLLVGTLAAAQAEAGDFPAAIATAQRAAALATALRLEDIAAKNRELIQLYRQGRPFHEKRGGK
jgi:tetratricopeptide (TPR) repeat protein